MATPTNDPVANQAATTPPVFTPEFDADNNVTNIPWDQFQSADDYRNFLKPFAPNLATVDSRYDFQGAYDARMAPSRVQAQGQPAGTYEYHMGSVGKDGLVLKAYNHPSYDSFLETEQTEGRNITSLYGRNYVTDPGIRYSESPIKGLEGGEEWTTPTGQKAYKYTDKNFSPWLDPTQQGAGGEPSKSYSEKITGVSDSQMPNAEDPNAYKQINAVVAGANVIRNIGSLVRERFRKNPKDLAPPTITAPKYQDQVTPVVQAGQRQIDKQVSSALSAVREGGGGVSGSIAVGANALESQDLLAEKAMTGSIQQQNAQAAADAEAQNAQQAAVMQTKQYNQQRSDLLAEKSEVAKAQAFESIINTVTGLTNASMSIDEYNKNNAMVRYQMESDSLDNLMYMYSMAEDAGTRVRLNAEIVEKKRNLKNAMEEATNTPAPSVSNIIGGVPR